MQLALIGVGRVGGAIVDSLTAYDRALDGGVVAGTVAVDTASADLASLRAVPRSNRVTVGETYPCRDGVDGDNELGASIAAEDIDAILAGVDSLPSHRADGFLVVAALGGGTGGGGAPVVARELHRLFARPVYGLGVLPRRDADGATAQRTVRSLVTFVREVDNLLLVGGGGASDLVDVTELARHLTALFETVRPGRPPTARRLADARDVDAGASVDRTPASASEPSDAVDTAVELETVLAVGGLSVLGYAVARPPQRRLADRFRTPHERSPSRTPAVDVVGLVRNALFDGVDTAESTRAERAWLVVTAPRQTFARPGVETELERGRQWLRDRTDVSVVGGRTVVTAGGPPTVTVALSGVRQLPRLTELWERAVETRREEIGGDESAPSKPGWRDGTFDPLF